MKFKLFFLLIISVFIGWTTGSSLLINSGDELRDQLDILHYDLELKLDSKNRMLSGNAKLTAAALVEMQLIQLDFYDNMKITDLSVNGIPSEFIHKDKIISISHTAVNDTFIIEIKYEGRPKKGGLSGFVFGERKKSSVVYNLNEPDFASTWFPCNDIPSDKALLDIKITNDSDKVSVSNGVLIDSYYSEGGMKTYHWKTFYPVSTYLICLYSADYVNFSDTYISQDGNDTMKIEYYVFEDNLENAKKDFEEHLSMMNYFAQTFGEYPFIKEKYGVALFLWQYGAMEHQTISGIGSNFITGKKYFNYIYVHELVHHWWGNAVGPATWKDIWLNEGFSTYSEALYSEHISGKTALQASMLSKFDDKPEVRLYDPGDNLFSSTIYDKGAWVLHMLRWETGDTIFFNILRRYFEKFKYSTASTEDFQQICEELSGKDLDHFFRQWVKEGDDIIKMDYSWESQQKQGKYLITFDFEQKQSGYDEYKFPLEIEVIFGNDKTLRETFYVDQRQITIEFEVDEKPLDIITDPDNWLLAVINKRVNAPPVPENLSR